MGKAQKTRFCERALKFFIARGEAGSYMAKEKKIETVKQLKEKIEKAKVVLFTDYRGLKTEYLNQLREDLAQSDSEYHITKNTLLARALKELGKDSLVPPETLQGPTAALFAYSDEINPIKRLLKLIKALELPVIKMGILDGQILGADQVAALGSLPGRKVLLGWVVGSLARPLSGLMNVLNGNTRNLVYVLKALKEVKR